MKNEARLVEFGTGWFPPEWAGLKSWRWSAGLSELSLKTSDTDSYTQLQIIPYACISPNEPITIDALDEQDKAVYQKKMIPGQFINRVVSFDIQGIKKLRFFSKVYVPQHINGSLDTRPLAFAVSKVILTGGNNKEAVYEAGEIPATDDLFVTITSDKTSFINFKEVLNRPLADLNNISVVLTCHGDRRILGERAYDSIIATGIKNIVITVSGDNEEYYDWANSKAGVIVVENRDPSITNHVCWRNGVAAVKTPYTIILHDDDLLSPGLGDELKYFAQDTDVAFWNGYVLNLLTNAVENSKIIDLPFKDRCYVSTKALRGMLSDYGYTVSPVHGCFKTSKLLECLDLWQAEQGTNPRWLHRPTFVVGNDLFIWEYFTRNEEELMFYTPALGVRCISHSGSATAQSIYKTLSTGQDDFWGIYTEVKNIYIGKKIKHGMLLYLPKLEPKHQKMFDNLAQYKMSKYDIPFVKYTDNSDSIEGFIQIPKIPPMVEDGPYRALDKYAFWSFIDGIKIAKEKGWDYFFMYEWDCMIGKDCWYDDIWEEHLAWPYKPFVSGTPALRFSAFSCGDFMVAANDYISTYTKQCQTALRIDYALMSPLYTNGALSFYDTEIMCEYHAKEINWEFKEEFKSHHVNTVGPWDYGLGVRMYRNIGNDVFKRVAWLPSVYSGCADIPYDETQRLAMLKSGKKAVIHQIKYA